METLLLFHFCTLDYLKDLLLNVMTPEQENHVRKLIEKETQRENDLCI